MVGSDVASANSVMLLNNLIAKYLRELDLNGGINSFQFFFEDGSLNVGEMSLHGHDEMKMFYKRLAEQSREQTQAGGRTTRHIYTNLIIDFHSQDAASLSFISMNFSADKAAPVSGDILPTIISDIQCECRWYGEKEWRIFSLSGTPVFIGGDSFQESILMGQ